jgi:hypothetical protein
MDLIATSSVEMHIAFNKENGLIYGVNKSDGAFRTLNPVSGGWGPYLDLNTPVSEITGATFTDDGSLMILSQSMNRIFEVDVATGETSVYDSYAPVLGGDIAFNAAGDLLLATREGFGSLYQVVLADEGDDNLIGELPQLVTGLALTADNKWIVSSKSSSSLTVLDANGMELGELSLVFNGIPYSTSDGDLASGCPGSVSPDPLAQGLEQDISLSVYPNPASGTELYFGVELSQTSALTLEIRNGRGELLREIKTERLEAGQNHKLTLGLNDFDNGLYLYRLLSEKEAVNGKFFIAR